MSSNTSTQNTLLQSTGLPKVPKVLNVIANSVNSQWQDSAKVYAAQMAMSMVRLCDFIFFSCYEFVKLCPSMFYVLSLNVSTMLLLLVRKRILHDMI